MPDSILLPLCTPDTHIRSNYYSDTYRASFAIRGVNKQWDITHIELPFPKEKERLLMARFGIQASLFPTNGSWRETALSAAARTTARDAVPQITAAPMR